jgi:hypothetical protein
MYAPIAFHFPFFMGGASHVGILNLLTTKDLDYSLSLAHTYMIEHRENHEKLEPLSAEEEQEFNYQVIAVEAIIKGYAKTKKKFVNSVKVIEKEHKMKKYFSGKKLVSKLDALIVYDDTKYIYELKTMGKMTLNNLMHYLGQFLFYHNAYSGKNIDIFVDMIQKPGIRQGKKESEEEFIKRLEEYYHESERYGSEIITLSPRLQLQYENELEKVIEEINESFNDIPEKGFYRDRHACYIYQPCGFLPLCDNGINPLQMMKYRKKTSRNEELEEGEIA